MLDGRSGVGVLVGAGGVLSAWRPSVGLRQADRSRVVSTPFDPDVEVLAPVALLLNRALGHSDLVVIVQLFDMLALGSEHVTHLRVDYHLRAVAQLHLLRAERETELLLLCRCHGWRRPFDSGLLGVLCEQVRFLALLNARCRPVDEILQDGLSLLDRQGLLVLLLASGSALLVGLH